MVGQPTVFADFDNDMRIAPDYGWLRRTPFACTEPST
jgi:hypothetical protein